MTQHFIWPQEMVDALPDLIERRLTPLQIRLELEAQFGVTISRGSLAGKLHRLKLKPLVDGRATKQPVGPTPQINPAITSTGAQTDKYAHLKWTCRYPMNDDMKNPIWCGNERQPDSPYCPHHHAICHASTKQELSEAEA